MKPSCHHSVGKSEWEAEFGEFSGKTGEEGAFGALEVIGAEVGTKDAASEQEWRRRCPWAGRVLL